MAARHNGDPQRDTALEAHLERLAGVLVAQGVEHDHLGVRLDLGGVVARQPFHDRQVNLTGSSDGGFSAPQVASHALALAPHESTTG